MLYIIIKLKLVLYVNNLLKLYLYRKFSEFYFNHHFLIIFNNILNNVKITVLNDLNRIIPLTISNINPLVIIPRIIQYNENIYNERAILFSVLMNY